MKKKVLSLLVACTVVIGTLVGCGSGTAAEQPAAQEETSVEEAAQAEAEETAEEVVDAPSFKFGFIHTSFSDQLGIMYQKYAQYAADELGCEIIFAEAADADSKISAEENMIELGVDGIIMTNCTQSQLAIAEDAGVYYIQLGSSIADEELKAYAEASEYYIGSCLVDNFQVGKNMIEALYEQGCRKFALVEFTPGAVTTMDDRAKGMEEALSSHNDAEVVTVYTGAPASFADGTEQILASYGDKVDGLASVMANAAIPASIISYGLADQIKYAGVDIQEGTDELLELGTMAYVAGGAFPNAEICVAMLYNYLTDYKIWEDKEDVTRPLIELQSVDDYNNYMKYFEGDLPCYSGEELKTIVGLYNPNVTMDDVRALANDSSVESCVARHKDLIN